MITCDNSRKYIVWCACFFKSIVYKFIDIVIKAYLYTLCILCAIDKNYKLQKKGSRTT